MIFANIELKADFMDEKTKNVYMNAISNEFNRMVSNASNGELRGEINFNAPQSDDQLHISMMWSKDKSNVAGRTYYGNSQVNLLDADGNVKSAEQFAFDNTHEILHTLNMPELTEKNPNISDTELIHSAGLNLKTTPHTAPNIIDNVMNYQFNYIDGARYKDKNPLPKQTITPGQLNFMLNEIKLQQKGEGKNQNPSYWMRY